MNPKIINEAILSTLPDPVQRYMHFTGVVGYPWIQSARLKQVGKFRQGADRPWMDFSAEETYTTNPAGFRWDAKFKMMGIPLLRVEDKYENGHGAMYGRLAGIKTIFDARGKEIDQGSMMRYLNEVMWFPTAYFSDYVQWLPIDANSAEIIMDYGGVRCPATVQFNKNGEMISFCAQRYMEVNGKYELKNWTVSLLEYGEFNGIKIPSKCEITWELETGDFSPIKLEITDVVYDDPSFI